MTTTIIIIVAIAAMLELMDNGTSRIIRALWGKV